MKTTGKKIYSTPDLRRIGLWATIWWGVAGLYIVYWVWLSQTWYVRLSTSSNIGFFEAWKGALRAAKHQYYFLQIIQAVVILGWIILFVMWFRALKKHNISYKAALKDLFLTIRK